VHTAHAPPYDTLLPYAGQLAGDMAGFGQFIEKISYYNFHYYYIPEQPHA